MVVCSPKNKWELSDMLKFAVSYDGPIAVRYPRGTAYAGLEEFREKVSLGKSEWIYREDEICLIAVGEMVETAEQVRDILKGEGHRVSLVNARFVKPLDREMILESCRDHKLLVTLEDNVITGGFGSAVLDVLAEEGCHKDVLTMGVPDRFIRHGSVPELKKEIGLDPESIADRIRKKLSALN
jgi:1-deoxy-D-xylulose-5-phosphate synthase